MSTYGKYRGTVVDNVDPHMIGRLRVAVPALGVEGAWAMPCFPVAGVQSGASLIPSPGTGVWVEFEEGDVNSPIWSGCWYGSAAEMPGPGKEIQLHTASGARISITDDGITLSNGKGAIITLVGPTVTINSGALEVT